MRLALEARLGLPCSQIDPRSVETLNLSNWSEPLDGDPILSSFKNLKVLRLSDTRIEDISFVSEMKNLEVLHLDHSSVVDLNPLEKTLKLRELWLDYSPVQDLNVLRKHLYLETDRMY